MTNYSRYLFCATVRCSLVVNDDVTALQCWYNAGVDFNLSDYNGRTALHVAVAHGLAEHVAYLLTHGADPRSVDIDGQTPLDEARKRSLANIAALLQNAASTTTPPAHVDNPVND